MSKRASDSTKYNPRAAHCITRGIWGIIGIYILLYLFCLIAYHGIHDNYLFNDDFSWLHEARHGMESANLITYRVVNFFRPLVNLSFYLLERISPGNIHLNYTLNLILHFLNTVLVFRLICVLLGSRRIAFATAVVFALTSVHTGAVFWISARTTLLSAFFLLASLTLIASNSNSGLPRIIGSIALYILALASKETAIAGMLLVPLLFVLHKKRGAERSFRAEVLVSFTAVSAIYLIIRKVVMGGFIQYNWGPGAHVLRNLAGGLLYQLYPWPIFSLFAPSATRIPEPGHPFIPEIVAIPLVLLLFWIGRSIKQPHEFDFAVGWTVLALLPASLFRYRFFSTESITQNRYYYLSSVGSVLVIVLLLSILWRSASRLWRTVTVFLFVILCAGYMARIDRLEKKWDSFTSMYREVVVTMIDEAEKFTGFSTIAIEDSPLAFPYIEDAIALTHPEWRIVEVPGGRDEAARWKPCLYVSYTGEKPKLMRMEKLE